MRKKKKYRSYLNWKNGLGIGALLFLIYFVFCLPKELFQRSTSTVLVDKNGILLNAKIAADEQWYFPMSDSVPKKFKAAIVAYEDRQFYDHFGISFSAIGRALKSNITAGKVISGGSTITMQIARMSRGKKRTYWQKMIESIWAVRMELRYSKEELLQLYASNAPFGGNVIGLEAAAWRYYGLPPHQLSWAEMATLSVLPNAPGLVHPGKNRARLLEKRNFVLQQLYKMGEFDEITLELAQEEPLIDAPHPLPSLASHVLNKAIKNGKKGERIQTTLSYQKQQQFSTILHRFQNQLNHNYIHNAAAIVINTKTNEVEAYIGNSATENRFQKYVDIISSKRSPGSVLKPFLFAALMEEGSLYNEMLIPDIPMYFDRFSPKNYDEKNDGAVRAKNALSRSLNIPSVYLLKEYGVERFIHKLRRLGLKSIDKSADYYGLSLILGGGETTLWEVANAYAGMTKTLNFYNATNSYHSQSWEEAKLFREENSTSTEKVEKRDPTHLDAGAIFSTYQALLEVNRPGMEASWQQFASSSQIAWKTGTSYGNRDAWAVGTTPNYVVGVWVGNATGEGRTGLIGTSTAGPILFELFSHLKNSNRWFSIPYDEMEELEICTESGFLATQDCPHTQTTWLPRKATRSTACHFHRIVLTDLEKRQRYYKECSEGISTKLDTFFVLPPAQAYYYQKRHSSYRPLPPLSSSCQSLGNEKTFTLIYPEHNSKLVPTKGLGGKTGAFIFEANSPHASSTLFWHIDDKYVGKTTDKHTISLQIEKGTHLLTVMDEDGNQKKIIFHVVE